MTIAQSNIKLGPPIRRSMIIERAESWLRPFVAYSQTRFHQNEYGAYRTDCSGYVSMAWNLPGIPPDRHGGLDTIGLAQVSMQINKDELSAGDIVLRTAGTNATRHVTVFHEWATGDRTSYWAFEQASGINTVHRKIAYPYDHSGRHYLPFRNRSVIS